jgi:hypothetical protein
MLKDFGFFQRIFLKIIFFAWWNCRVSIILLFALRYFWINVNGKAAVWAHSLFTKRKANLWGKGRKTCYNLTLVTSSHLQARERERERERLIVGMQHRMLSFGSVWSLPLAATSVSNLICFDCGWTDNGHVSLIVLLNSSVFVPTNKECQTKSVRTDNLLYISIYMK